MTLIELLLTVSIIAILSVALYKSLDNGLKVWKKGQNLVFEEDVVIFFEKMTQDLRNSFFYASIPFEGDETRLAFPTIVDVPKDKKAGPAGGLIEQIGKVEYSFDAEQNIIYRKKANYSQALEGKFFEPQAVVHNVKDIKIEYAYLTKEGDVLSPKVLDFLPFAVVVEVQFLDNKGEGRLMEKIINVPVGG